ncbi:hypothetical protein GWI33_011747, partial [Rhynchophorus ferrugineus]
MNAWPWSGITIVTPTMKTETSILETPIVLVTETSTSSQSSEDKAITPTSVSTEVVEVTQTLNDNISLSVNSSSTTGLLEVHDNNIPTLESSMPEVLPTVTDSSTSTTVLPTGTLHTTETAMQTENVTESTK